MTEQLAGRVAQVARITPVERLDYLSSPEKTVLAKREDLQVTGSFKARGAAAKLATLTADRLGQGVVAASTGNHGLAVAHAAGAMNVPARIYVPDSASQSKVAAIRAKGATIEVVPGNALGAERAARRAATAMGATYISPYNDSEVVAGQGTIGRELRSQVDRTFTLVASVGGGGLLSGIASNLPGRLERVVGTSPEIDAAMAASVAAGEIVAVQGERTLSDGTAGDLEPGAITLELCARLVDDWVLQSEAKIAAAMDRHHGETGVAVEGSAALALATAADLDVSGVVVVIICGGNV